MNGICTIELEPYKSEKEPGKKVKLFFGLIALERFKDKVKQYRLLDSKTYSLATIAHVMYAGYINACFIDDASIDYPFSVFYEFVEATALAGNYEPIHTAMANFEASKFVKGAAGNTANETEEKKNLRTSISTPSENSVSAS